MRLFTDESNLALSEDAERVTVRFSALPHKAPIAERFAAEMFASGIGSLVTSFSGERPERVNFTYAPPLYHAEYARVFAGSERFEQPFTGLTFDRRFLHAAPLHQDDEVHDALRLVAERRILRLTGRIPYSTRVREQLAQQGPTPQPDIVRVARALGLSERSLRRRLAREGKTFHLVANEAAAAMAKQLLLTGDRSIQETAYEMGFSNTSTFHRAFKRWTGMTPRRYVDKQLHEND
jgi:AraC-like DNA-binding protein